MFRSADDRVVPFGDGGPVETLDKLAWIVLGYTAHVHMHVGPYYTSSHSGQADAELCQVSQKCKIIAPVFRAPTHRRLQVNYFVRACACVCVVL